MLAKNLNLPEENIRVVATPLGGGFGKKCDSFLEAPAAVAGYVCQKPVKITLTRQEDLIETTKRHGYHTDYESASPGTGNSSIWTAACTPTAAPTRRRATAPS